MIKLILLTAFFVLFSINSFAQAPGDYTGKNDYQTLVRISGIKSKTIWEYYYVPGEENSFRDSGFKSFSYFYDNSGRISEYTKYHVYAPLTIKELYTYNPNGNLGGTTRQNSNGDVIETIEYKYSSKNLLKKEIHNAFYNSVRKGVYFTITANVNEGELFDRLQEELQIEPKLESYMITINITDPEELNQYVVIGDEGEPTALRFSWSQLSAESQKQLLSYEGPNRKENTYKSKFISEVIYKYDKSGNLVDRSVYNTANDRIDEESYRYNSESRKINYYKYDDKGKISSMESYTYDASGRLGESIGLDPTGKTVSRIKYGYNDQGLLSEKLWINSAGIVNGKFIYTYDADGRIKEEMKYRGESEKESRSIYSYDSNGNLMKIIQYDASDKKERLWKYDYLTY